MHVIFRVDNSGLHAVEVCVCLMGVVCGVQSLTFFFHLQHTKEHQTDMRNAALPCSCNADHSYTDTFHHLTRTSLLYNCQEVFSSTNWHCNAVTAPVQRSCDRQSDLFMGLQSTNRIANRMTFTASSELAHSCIINQ